MAKLNIATTFFFLQLGFSGDSMGRENQASRMDEIKRGGNNKRTFYSVNSSKFHSDYVASKRARNYFKG